MMQCEFHQWAVALRRWTVFYCSNHDSCAMYAIQDDHLAVLNWLNMWGDFYFHKKLNCLDLHFAIFDQVWSGYAFWFNFG